MSTDCHPYFHGNLSPALWGIRSGSWGRLYIVVGRWNPYKRFLLLSHFFDFWILFQGKKFFKLWFLCHSQIMSHFSMTFEIRRSLFAFSSSMETISNQLWDSDSKMFWSRAWRIMSYAICWQNGTLQPGRLLNKPKECISARS